jgi:hypothetical protein
MSGKKHVANGHLDPCAARLGRELDRLRGGSCHKHVVTPGAERLQHQAADSGFIFDHENALAFARG